MIRKRTFIYLLAVILLAACEQENPLDNEQYRKEVYIVGANQSNNQGLSTVKLPYLQSSAEEFKTYISVAIGGSKQLDRDISVTVSEAGTSAISRYNFLYLFNPADVRFQYLASDYYRIPEKTVTIPAGGTYARVPIYLKTADLHTDSLYALTFKVASVSEPAYVSIRPRDTTLIFSISLNNKYSGAYQLQGTYVKEGSTNPADIFPVSGARNFKAVNHNTIRLIHTANAENLANAATLGVSVRVNPDNTLSLSPWNSFALTDGGGTYDPAGKTFNVWYTFRENNITYKFTGQYVANNI